MKGNDALGEGAVLAGCDAYFGYPITPQNELTAYMAKRMADLGRVFIQAESELSAINMVFGASVVGKRAMTSSSSPGISLKQEGISYLAGCELPAVIVNVGRGGPGLGNIAGSQADYFQATRGGGHGDYRTIVLAPSSVQEMFEFPFIAFDLADKYRNPVMILSDGVLAQMMEPVIIKEKKPNITDKPWALTGAKNRKPQRIVSLLMAEGALEEHNYKIEKKYKEIKENETMVETYETNDADVIIVAFGTSARICKEVINTLRKTGIKVGLVRPITLWPFPYGTLKELSKIVKGFLVVEMNLGQMIEDVLLSNQYNTKVLFYGVPGGGIPKSDIIERKVKEMI